MHADAHCFAHAVTPLLHETNNSLDVFWTTTTTTREVLANNAIIRARAQKLFCRLSFRSQINFSFFFLFFLFFAKGEKKKTETQTLNMAAAADPDIFFSPVLFSRHTKKTTGLLIPSRLRRRRKRRRKRRRRKKKKKKRSGVR